MSHARVTHCARARCLQVETEVVLRVRERGMPVAQVTSWVRTNQVGPRAISRHISRHLAPSREMFRDSRRLAMPRFPSRCPAPIFVPVHATMGARQILCHNASLSDGLEPDSEGTR
eukprot:3971433-Pleurochrysis_carterae.AAC.3